MHIHSDTDAPVCHLPGIEHRTLAGSAAGLSRLSVWRQALAPDAATPAHRHDCEEVVLVEAGRGELVIHGERQAFGPGTTLVIPPDAAHQIVNTGAQPLRMVAIFSTSPVEVTQVDGQPLPLPWTS